MKLEVLMATMNRSDYTIIKKNKITSDVLVINQNGESGKSIFSEESSKITWINSNQIGLSNSRNMAIDNSTGDILLIADDDLIYRSGYEELVLNYFKKNTEIDICSFNVKVINGTRNIGFNASKEAKLKYREILKISSVQIAFRRKSIIDNKLWYDIFFGPGGFYNSGDENVFLYKCLKKGLKFGSSNIVIADLDVGNSVWFEGFDEKYFFDRGAIFCSHFK